MKKMRTFITSLVFIIASKLCFIPSPSDVLFASLSPQSFPLRPQSDQSSQSSSSSVSHSVEITLLTIAPGNL
ncbi:hypothetical protein BGX38DRAFT_1228797 [Terfezia claveryi]|nr:hypothetical protein BGX38DRAFT_1228797 [Terfezia claveryi]